MDEAKEMLAGILVVLIILIVSVCTTYKVAHSKGVLTGRLVEIEAKVKILEQNYYPAALPEEKK